MTFARRYLISTLATSFLVLAALSARADDNVQRIRLSLLPFSESLGAVIAEKEGFFKEDGLQVETTLFASGALALPVLQSGRIDIAFSNTIATLQVIERGLDIIVLGPGATARKTAPDTTFAVMVLKDGIKNLKELEGKRVAVNVIRSATWLYIVAGLEAAGVDWTKVRFIELPNTEQNAALLNKQVDAITQPEPFRTVLMDTGKAEILQYPMVATGPARTSRNISHCRPGLRRIATLRSDLPAPLRRVRNLPTLISPSRARLISNSRISIPLTKRRFKSPYSARRSTSKVCSRQWS